jgi:translocation and assembly module TamB
MKRVLVIGARVLALVIGVLAVLVGATMLLLQTNWGGERLRRQAVTQVNRQIEGHLDIGRLWFGGDRVVVWDVTLRDPDGELVAQLARAEVDVAPLRLLHKEVRVTDVIVDAPRLALVSEPPPRGSNLSRATAPRRPAPAKPPAPAKGWGQDEGWVIRLDRFRLNDGDASVVTRGPASPDRRLHVAALQSFMAARLGTGNGSFAFTFSLRGDSMLAPAGALAIAADGHGRGQGTVDDARLSVAFGEYLDLQARGRAAKHDARLALDGSVLHGTVKVRAAADPQRLETAESEVAIAIPAARVRGDSWGPLRFSAEVHRGVLEALELFAAVPGVELTATNDGRDHGGARGARWVDGVGGGIGIGIGIKGRLALTDLARTARAIEAITGGALPPLAGGGRIDFAAAGPFSGAPASLSGQAHGRFNRLRLGETAVAGLSLNADLSHATKRPTKDDLALAADLAVSSLRSGATQLTGLALAARASGDDVSVTARLAAPQRVRLAMQGRLARDRHGLALTDLTLDYPGGRWTSEGTAQLAFGGQTVSIADFMLVSRGQRLGIDASKSADRVNAHVALAGLRLDLLPAFAVDPALKLGGVVDLDVKAEGALDNPSVRARLSLLQGRFRAFSGIRAQADASLADRRAAATVDVRTAEVGRGHLRFTYVERDARAGITVASPSGGTLRVDARAALDLMNPGAVPFKSVPVSGRVRARQFDVGWASGFSERLETLAGQVTADAALAGTVKDPRLVGDVHWKNGRVVTTAAASAPTSGQ